MMTIKLLRRLSRKNSPKVNTISLQSFSIQKCKHNKTQISDTIIETPEIEETLEKAEKFKEYVEQSRNVSRLTRPRFTKNSWQNFSMPYVQIQSKINTEVAWSKVKEKIQIEKEYDLTLEQKIKMFIDKKNAEIDSYNKE